jgi:hypothetical protein
LYWEKNLPKLTQAQPIEGADEKHYWMTFQAGTHPNELLGVDATSEKVYLLDWNPTTQILTAKRPVIAEIKSPFLTLVELPTPETLALIQKKAEALAPNESEREILTTLRAQPSRQNGFSRLGAMLRFAPRDL